MKINYSLPKNDDFFSRYATLIPTLSKLGVISQLVSGLTEIGIIYSIILSRLYHFDPLKAEIIAIIGAIIGTAFLEIGLRKFTPYSIKAFLYKRFKGLDLAMTIFIVLVCIGLFSASGTLSFKGSKDLVVIASPTPILETTNEIDNNYSERKAELKTIFSTDSLVIANGYSKQMTTENNRFNSLVDKEKSDLNRLIRKEERTGLSYRTRKETIRGNIASLEAGRNTEISRLQALQSKELRALTVNRRSDIKAIEQVHQNDRAKIEGNNIATLTRAETNTAYYGNGLAWFTIACLCVFLFSIIIEEIHKKGSGIEQIALPNQYYFSQSVLADFTNMVSEKVNYKVRNRIKQWANSTPPPPLPLAPPSLYDLSNANQQKVLFTLEETNNQYYVLKNRLMDIDQQPEIKRRIGFNVDNDDIRKSYNDTNTPNKERACLNCSTTYIYKHHKQKYCTDDCRINAWEKRTGKELKLKKKK